MPKEFTDCVNAGGKVVTKKLSKDKYIHICYDKEGTAHPGEVKKKEKKSKSHKNTINNARKQVKDNKKLADQASLLKLQEHINGNYHS